MKSKHPVLWFTGRMATDPRLSPYHLALYAALAFQGDGYPTGHFFPVTRKKLMPLSGIRSIATYHRRLAELVSYGYILYQPSYNPYTGSQAALLGSRHFKDSPKHPHQQHNGNQIISNQ